MKMPLVNKATCIGCGTCTALCPNTFILKEDNKAYVAEPQGEPEAKIQEAIDACPVGAITWKNS